MLFPNPEGAKAMDIRITVSQPGGADCMQVEPCQPQEPGPGEIRLRHEAIGVNFLDIYHRSGLYPLAFPSVLGVEGAGVTEAVGPGVTCLKPGDRVAYAGGPLGAYASTRLLPEARAIRLPEDVSTRAAAASMLKGLTAHMLLTRTYPVGRGTAVLVHAAAGGLGGMLTRWAKHLGAVVIGTVSSEPKAELARANGADHLIVGRDADVPAAVASLTGGLGADYAIDGIGGGMLLKTLASVRKFGTVASIGQAAGPIPPVAVEALGPLRSLSLARPSVMAYSSEADTYPMAARAVLESIRAGLVSSIGGEYSLAEAAATHAELEAGRSAGSLLLIP
jgi:NADPH:quinone reductase